MSHSFEINENTDTSNGKDVSDTARMMRDKAIKARDDAAEKMHDVRAEMSEKAEYAQQHVQDLAGDAKRSLEETVRRNPTMAVAGAVGIGVLLGLAMRNAGR